MAQKTESSWQPASQPHHELWRQQHWTMRQLPILHRALVQAGGPYKIEMFWNYKACKIQGFVQGFAHESQQS